VPGQQIASRFAVTVAGTDVPPEYMRRLTWGYVDDNRHLPDTFALRFVDPGRDLLSGLGLKVGATITIGALVADDPSPTPLLDGEVTAVEAEYDGSGTFTVLRGYDSSHKLMRGTRAATYQNMTAADIVNKVATDQGLQAGPVDPGGPVYEHVLQAQESDWAFLHRLARENDRQLTLEKGSVGFTAPVPTTGAPAAGANPDQEALLLDLGIDILRLRTTVTSAEQVPQVAVTGWDVDAKQSLRSQAQVQTRTLQAGTSPADLSQPYAGASLSLVTVPFGTASECDTMAAALAERLAGSCIEIEGVARGNPKMMAGTAIRISSLGEPFDGAFTLTSVRHGYDPANGYTTQFAVTGEQERSLHGLVTSGGSAGNVPPRVYGVVPAVVTRVDDDKGLDRVKVRFPWLTDTEESDWARVAEPGGGKGRGLHIPFEVDDEVLVAFEHGDMRRPFVVGGLHNGVDPVPATASRGGVSGYVAQGRVVERSWVSRSGHRLDFVESQGKSLVTLQSADGSLYLDLDQTGGGITINANGSVTVKATNGVVVDAGSSDITMKGGSITLQAQQAVKVSAGTDMSLTAAKGFTVSAGSGLDLTSGASASLTATSYSVTASSSLSLVAGATASLEGGATVGITGGLVRIN
jgi:phage protein D